MSSKPLKIRLATRLRKNDLWSRLTHLTGHELKGKSWIFIIGCYNSGTTLLEKILARHADLGSLSEEGVMLTGALPRPEDFGWRRMWHRCETQMAIDPAREVSVANHVKRHWSNYYNERRLLIEKSISNTPRVLFFERNFKPAYIIHIVRNGYAVSEGIMRKAAVIPGNEFADQGHYPIEVCAQQWKRSLEVVEEAKSKLTNFLEIRYEDLTDRPEETMALITKFLNIEPFSNEMFNESFTIHQKTEAIVNMNSRSIARLSKEEWSKVNAVCGSYLKKLGYFQPEKL